MAGSMRQLEAKIYNKLQNDFPDEIQVLEQGVNAIVRYAMLVNELAPCQGGSSSLEELLNASGEDKRISTQIMLLNHSVENMMASRLLLLTGHLGPAMACLRTSFEAFHNAHICSVLEEQATNFLIGKQIDKKVDIDFPIQLKDEKVKEIKRILSDVGVHAKYKALENQGYFEGAIFHDEHKATYEFLVYRCLFSYYSVQLDLIGYFAGQWPRLANNVPNIVEVTKNLKKRMNNTIEEVKKRAEN